MVQVTATSLQSFGGEKVEQYQLREEKHLVRWGTSYTCTPTWAGVCSLGRGTEAPPLDARAKRPFFLFRRASCRADDKEKDDHEHAYTVTCLSHATAATFSFHEKLHLKEGEAFRVNALLMMSHAGSIHAGTLRK